MITATAISSLHSLAMSLEPFFLGGFPAEFLFEPAILSSMDSSADALPDTCFAADFFLSDLFPRGPFPAAFFAPGIPSPDILSPGILFPDIFSLGIPSSDILSPDILSPGIPSPDILSPDILFLGIPSSALFPSGLLPRAEVPAPCPLEAEGLLPPGELSPAEYARPAGRDAPSEAEALWG